MHLLHREQKTTLIAIFFLLVHIPCRQEPASMVRNDEQPAGLWMELSAGTWNDSCPLHTCICNFTACYASIQNCPQQRKQFHRADRRQHIFPYSRVCKRNSNQWACIYSRLCRSNLQQQRNNLHQRNYNQPGSSVWRRVQLHTNLYTECFQRT